MITAQDPRGIQHVESNEDHIYLNVSISANDESSANASYSESRPQAIVPKGDDYQLAVTRFNIPLGRIPLLIFRIQTAGEFDPPQTNPNLGVYIFTLTFGVNDYSENVIFQPDLTSIPVPNPPSDNNNEQVDSSYYYVYTLNRILFLFNTTLETAFTALKLANPAAPQTEAPFFFADSDNKIHLVTQIEYNDAVDPVEIFINNPLNRFFDGMDFIFEFSSDVKEARFVLYEDPLFDNGYTPFGTVPVTPPTHIQQIQQDNNIGAWSELKAIIFQTSLIPIRQENIASTGTEGQDIIQTILTDFDVSGWQGNRNPISFASQGPYRYIDILSHTPIRSFNLDVLWRDSQGRVRFIEVFSNPITVKLAFIRKHLVS